MFTSYFVTGIANILLAITASCGNILILIALQKEFTLSSPSTVLFRSLAASDVFVGLISQPIFAANIILTGVERHWDICPQHDIMRCVALNTDCYKRGSLFCYWNSTIGTLSLVPEWRPFNLFLDDKHRHFHRLLKKPTNFLYSHRIVDHALYNHFCLQLFYNLLHSSATNRTE